MANEDKWEYLCIPLNATIDNTGAKELMKQFWPAGNGPKFSVVALTPRLNSWGNQGWELMHIEPVGQSTDGKLVSAAGVTDTYLCVFKRKKRD